MRAVLVQATPIPGDLGANVERVCRAVQSAGRDALVVFPELFLSGYRLERLAELAVSDDHPAVTRIADTARGAGAAVVVGAVERLRGGFANSALTALRAAVAVAILTKDVLFIALHPRPGREASDAGPGVRAR